MFSLTATILHFLFGYLLRSIRSKVTLAAASLGAGVVSGIGAATVRVMRGPPVDAGKVVDMVAFHGLVEGPLMIFLLALLFGRMDSNRNAATERETRPPARDWPGPNVGGLIASGLRIGVGLVVLVAGMSFLLK